MFNFFVPLLLFGLGAVVIPPLIHLLNRRRFEVVEWGAMQFLQISETTRRRLLIEEILLMLMRMGLIAILVLAMAGPFLQGWLFPGFSRKASRDVVLVFDGSYSMSYTEGGPSAHDQAKEWAIQFVQGLNAGDSVAVLQAKQQVVPIVGKPTVDLEAVRTAIGQLPAPAGGCDWPAAAQEAHDILRTSGHHPNREIIFLTDGQRHGWADDGALLGWRNTANKLAKERPDVKPRLTVINLAPNRPADPPNWSLAPLESSRAVAAQGREVRFTTALRWSGQSEYRPPYKVRLEVDGKFERDLAAPLQAKTGKEGQVKLPPFTHKFATPGSHLVSVIVEPDPPPSKREPNYVPRDYLPGDNRQDFALEVVPALPVLIVDGEDRPPSPSPSERKRGTDFLSLALMPKGDPPAVLAVVLPLARFDEAALTKPLGNDPSSKPRVLILFNVPRLRVPQQEAIARFLAGGGGVLVTLGDRPDPQHYNDELYRGGEGWLPAKLGDIDGDEVELSRAAALLPESFQHPALEMFRKAEQDGLVSARFPRWWKVTVPARSGSGGVGARLNTKDPFLVEKTYQNGRVLLCTVPLDDSWRTNLTRDNRAFPVLAHELVAYLAGASSAAHNLKAGEHIRYSSPSQAPVAVKIKPPQGDAKEVKLSQGPLDFSETRETGIYELQPMKYTSKKEFEAAGPPVYFVVQPDARESNLTPASDEDKKKVSDLVPMNYAEKNVDLTLQGPDQKQELWFWFLVGVVVLLCGEVWLTRRIVLNR